MTTAVAVAMDDGWRLSIRDRPLCFLETAIYQPPEAFNVHTPGYAHAAVVRLSDHCSAYLPSLLVVTAMQPISYDADVPPLASAIVELHE